MNAKGFRTYKLCCTQMVCFCIPSPIKSVLVHQNVTSFYYNIAVYLPVMCRLGGNVIWDTKLTEQTYWNIAGIRHTFLRAFSVQSSGRQVFESNGLPYC